MIKKPLQKSNTKATSSKIGANYTPEDIKKFDEIAKAMAQSLNKNAK